jgi:hypothetical protein
MIAIYVMGTMSRDQDRSESEKWQKIVDRENMDA